MKDEDQRPLLPTSETDHKTCSAQDGCDCELDLTDPSTHHDVTIFVRDGVHFFHVTFLVAFAIVVLGAVGLRFWVCGPYGQEDSAHTAVSKGFKPVTPDLGLPKNIATSLAQLSPWFPAGGYTTPPEGCVIDQVNIIQRHGARFPTKNAIHGVHKAYLKLANVIEYKDSRFDFIHKWKFTFGEDVLVPFGAQQSFDAGQQASVRYGSLVNSHNPPFVRAAGQERVVNSAQAWSAGFALASTGSYNPALSVIIPEGKWEEVHQNNTLAKLMCPNAKWNSEPARCGETFGKSIVDRLNKAAPGANMILDDVASVMSLCGFDSVAGEYASPWCSIFEDGDFYGFDYLIGLDTYYINGYGNPLGRVQGVGYVNELLARLTDSPVHDHTQTNHTLDADPATFPLNRTLYADFSHDTQMQAIFAALGLFKPDAPLDPRSPSSAGPWVVSRMTPFSARMVTERMRCSGGAREGAYVRVVVNDEVQPLDFCEGAEEGACALESFVASQRYAREEYVQDWEKCLPRKSDHAHV